MAAAKSCAISVLALVDAIPLPSVPLPCYTPRMKKWFKEDFEWEIEVTGFLRGSETGVALSEISRTVKDSIADIGSQIDQFKV